MKKEEFLAMSLPYGLVVSNENANENFLLAGLNLDSSELLVYSYIYGSINESVGEYGINMFKPILHPMSDLIKAIEHNGEKFIPLHRLLEHSSFNLGAMTNKDIMEFADIYSNVDLITVNDLPLYLEWKFDIAGLIDKGKAIDVNTLKINPYK